LLNNCPILFGGSASKWDLVDRAEEAGTPNAKGRVAKVYGISWDLAYQEIPD